MCTSTAAAVLLLVVCANTAAAISSKPVHVTLRSTWPRSPILLEAGYVVVG